MAAIKLAVALALFGLCASAPARPEPGCTSCSNAVKVLLKAAAMVWEPYPELSGMYKTNALYQCEKFSREKREKCKSDIEQNWPQMFADIMGKKATADQICTKYYSCPTAAVDRMVLSASGNELLNDAKESVRFSAMANTDFCAYGLDQCVTMCDAKKPDQYRYQCGNNPTSGDILPSSCTCIYK